MSEEPLAISKEAKTLQQGLKDLLKTRDPWNKEVEFQRRNLQKQYLLLLLIHPNAKESKDAETHMWMQTSYALISIYKTRIAALERALREAGTQRQQSRAQRPGPVEYRKLMQRFKQFLSTEEKFWTQLVVRIQRQFSLSEARTALSALSIVTETDPAVDDVDSGKQDHFRFPPEPTDTPSPKALPLDQRNARRATLSKALIVLGDLARYREQYNEGPARSRGGPERGGRGGRGRGSQTDSPRVKTYDKARACYECARDLVPDEGNASHQLAILASYQKDTFESLVQYYKSLCVRVAYDPAAENMGNVLSKVLDAWRRRRKSKSGAPPPDDPNRGKTNTPSFKDNVILLHALWRLNVEEMDSIAPKHDDLVVKEFSELVSDRALSIDTISKIIIAAQGALWKQRKIRASADTSMEARITSHILALYRALLLTGITELDEAAKIVEEDLAMRITATFRRTLPALRIASKWLRVNLDHVVRANPRDVKDGERDVVIREIRAFWDAYTSFSTRIVLVFPPTSLPKLKHSLEEDVDARGYLPLGGLLMQGTPTGSDEADPRTPEQVHPNEEQLMRIWDIGHDARLIAEVYETPMGPFRAQFSLIDSVQKSEAPALQESTIPAAVSSPRSRMPADDRQSEEDDARTETTDPVGDAFREALSVPSSEDEQDEIVWNPRAVSPPTVTPVLSNKSTPHSRSSGLSPLGPAKPNIGFGPVSPTRVPDVPPPPLQPIGHHPAVQASNTPKTTAQDLLNNVMGLGRPSHKTDAKSPFSPHFTHQQSLHSPVRQHQRLPSSSQPPAFFAGPAGSSIWSTAPDESALGLSPRHQANSHLPTSPSMGLAPIGHSGLQTGLPTGLPTTTHTGTQSGNPSNLLPSTSPSSLGLWPAFERTDQMLPTHVPHIPQAFSTSAERPHRRVASSSIGSGDAYTEPNYQASVVYASGPRHTALPSHAPEFAGQQVLSNAFNDTMVLSSTIGSQQHPSTTMFSSNSYPLSPTGARSPFGIPKYGEIQQQHAGGIWGDAG